MSHPFKCQRRPYQQKGIVLPIALIMLVILSFAGLMAARKSSTYEQVSNNLRTNQVARQAAEDGLRFCEKAVVDQVDNKSATFGTTVTGKFFTATTPLANDKAATLENGLWNTKTSWVSGASKLITVAGYAKNAPTCIIETMASNRYLITSRGLSMDASLKADGTLNSGSEVWLQSILTPQAPLTSTSAAGGVQ